MDAVKSVTATFDLASFDLSVTKSGAGTGRVTSTPPAIDCGSTCAFTFNVGDVVALTATPDPGMSFAGWSGACSGTRGCSITMDAAKTVDARFDTITVNSPGTPATARRGSPATPADLVTWTSRLEAVGGRGQVAVYIALIGTVSPMIGLLGTVDGMVAAFRVIASTQTQPKPSQLAEGISTALITTLVGLWLAIPAIAAYGIFRNRLQRLVLEVGIYSERLMSRFQSVGTKKA
jgi:hypothetical protein